MTNSLSNINISIIICIMTNDIIMSLGCIETANTIILTETCSCEKAHEIGQICMMCAFECALLPLKTSSEP
jgi:hypothetical protein